MDIARLFEDVDSRLRCFNRNDYESTFVAYCESIDGYKLQCKQLIAGAESEREKLLEMLAQSVVDFKKEEIAHTKTKGLFGKSKWQQDQNLFMAAYLLPALVENKEKELCDLAQQIAICWSKAFKNSQIQVGTFEQVSSGFALKLFGFG